MVDVSSEIDTNFTYHDCSWKGDEIDFKLTEVAHIDIIDGRSLICYIRVVCN